MKKIKVSYKFMDYINLIIAILLNVLVIIFSVNSIKDSYPELGSLIALISIIMLPIIGQVVYKLLSLFLNDGRD